MPEADRGARFRRLKEFHDPCALMVEPSNDLYHPVLPEPNAL